MDLERETTEELCLFFNLWNECLAKESGIAGYKFNPFVFVCDKAGANHNALHQVYGISFGDRLHTCRMHFNMSVRKKRSLVPSHKKPIYDQLTQQLVTSATVAGYQEALDGLKTLSRGD